MDIDSDTIKELILAHLDQRLSDEEFAQLEQFLRDHPKARAEYIEMANLDAALRDSSCRQIENSPIKFQQSNPTNYPNWIAIAALIGILALPLAILLRNNDTASNSPDLATTKGIAVITAEANALWADNGKSLSQGVALEPGRVELLEGLAQIDFFGGASITLSGPSELELITRDAAVLHRGKLKAAVPPAARGFEIRSGQVLLEDLGTSFGLAVNENDQADIIVFDGEVRATGRNGKPMLLLDGDAARLTKGEASRQSPDKMATEFPDITDVIAGAGDREHSRYTAWKEDSLDRRRDPRLIAYFDFENLTAATRRLRNQAVYKNAGELDGGIVGARVSKGRWREKTALEFGSEGDRVRFNIPGQFDSMTLYAWVRIDALDRRMNSLFLTDYFDKNEIHWQLSNKGALHFACSPKGVIDLEKHNRRFFSDIFWHPGKSGQWFLLATTATSGSNSEVIHYINGKSVGFSGGFNREKALPMMEIGAADLGNWTEPIWPKASIRTLNGRIDEFAIFSSVLSAAEIAKIYEIGRP